jgi:thiol:disulfide interchange protein
MRMAVMVVALACCGPTGHGPRLLPYAVEEANNANQPLVVELGATWCRPCRIFETNVLPDPRVQEALRGVTFVRYDIDTPAGADAARRIGTHAVPVVAGIDREGTVRVFKKGTEQTAENFLEFLREVHEHLDQR